MFVGVYTYTSKITTFLSSFSNYTSIIATTKSKTKIIVYIVLLWMEIRDIKLTQNTYLHRHVLRVMTSGG